MNPNNNLKEIDDFFNSLSDQQFIDIAIKCGALKKQYNYGYEMYWIVIKCHHTTT